MSSKTSVPMEPAPPPSRIEELEKTINRMRMRIQGLEAVLRSIAEFNRYGEASEIASRALENKL